ncbi:deoxyhypusine synthase [Candidatus Woesearchaeota archaeon]|nr:deoxyhypusine synthase [Candidatus Woesearchaeota archaeon]
MRRLFSGNKERHLIGKRILPEPITKDYSVSKIIDTTMLAYNGGRIRAACNLLVKKYAPDNVTIGVSIAGALTPAGMGPSTIIPLMKHGYIDFIVATGANMYHDMHYAFNMPLYQGSHLVNDKELREDGVVRIYDILLDYDGVLMKTDHILRKLLTRTEFQKEMGTQEFYHHLGKILDQYEKDNKLHEVSVLAAAYRYGVPVFTSSPGDSTIGMNVAGLEVLSNKFKLRINPSIDVNESTAIILHTKKTGGKTGVILVGGGSPKNFLLQTEPQIQEVLMIPEVGQDYFLQITDARPDTGGLSGATPSEAVSWGKVDPDQVDDTVIIYSDATIVLPLITSYILQNTKPKKLKRLYEKRKQMADELKNGYFEHNDEIDMLKKMLEKNEKE